MEMIDAKLRLGPPGGSDVVVAVQPAGKRSSAVVRSEASGSTDVDHDAAPASKAQVVGWPPVRASYRKNAFQHAAAEAKAGKGERKQGGLYVKVGMDGAPYLRKVDLRTCGGYRELRDVLDAPFGCFSSSSAADGAQFAVAYEDKDGDLMLAGDVPWVMFICSCKKLRIIRGVPKPDEVIKEAAIYSKLLLDAMRMERNGHDSHEGDRWIDARRATDHRICMEGSLGNWGPPGQAPRCTLFYPRIRTWR